MNSNNLENYLHVFSKEGYAKDPGTKNPDGSKTIRHTSEDGEWNTVDTYWGGEPYAGCQTVLFQGKPFWSAVYYGSVNTDVEDFVEVYQHLRRALDNTDSIFPVRGPKELVNGNMKYTNNWSGTLEKFEGKERIYRNDKEVYSATYMGGLVNQREE